MEGDGSYADDEDVDVDVDDNREIMYELFRLKLRNELPLFQGGELKKSKQTPYEESLVNRVLEDEIDAAANQEWVDAAEKKAHLEVGRMGLNQLQVAQTAGLADLTRLQATLGAIELGGLRELHCQTKQWAPKTERAVVREHIQRPDAPRVPKVYPKKWYLGDDPFSDQGDDPDEEELMAEYATDDPRYGYEFMFEGKERGSRPNEPSPWPTFVANEEKNDRRYFSNKWTIPELERLRTYTVRHYYGFPSVDATNTIDQTTQDELYKQAEAEVDALKGRMRWNLDTREWVPWMGNADMWKSAYFETIHDRVKQEHKEGLAGASDLNRMKQELKTRKGPANDLFVWRIVVVHLRRLRAMGVPPFIPVTDCFDMRALISNVAHLIKYRRCIKWAKSIYKTAGVGSLGDQHRAKLLNRNFAHDHQDKRDTELGIARRIIRQAHVANYVQFMYRAEPGMDDQDLRYLARDADVVGMDASTGRGRAADETYRTEKYLTNPPMAPIMCTAPPRMGKSALSLLMASFAVKMGGTVHYGVAPNKLIPEFDIRNKLSTLGWVAQWGMLESEIRVYSHDEASSVEETNVHLQATANRLTGWTLHIRDEAQNLVRSTQVKVAQNQISLKEELENSFPLFYGLSMCVSATLLPVMCLEPVTGDFESVRDLLDFALTQRRLEYTMRPHWEQLVVLQPWSFPTGPDFLVPPRGAYPTAYPNPEDGYGDADKWYEDYYDPRFGDGEAMIERTTRYYGTWFHVKDATNRFGDPVYLQAAESGVLIDSSLERARAENDRWVDRLPDRGKGGEALFKPLEAFGEYLKNFNKHNTQYFNEHLGVREQGAATRIVSWPIACLTADAARMIHHAQQWMEESPRQCEANLSSKRLYPMLISAPRREKQGKNGRLEWAVLLCKLAWLRMHKDYVNLRLPLETTPDELAKRYGITVLIYSSDKKKSAYAHVVAQPEDISVPSKEKRVIAITFDPRLPENRFANYRFTDAGLTGENRGRLLPSVFAPTLTPELVDNYRLAFEGRASGMSAYDHVRENVKINLYRFDMKRCYPPCPEEGGVVRRASASAQPDGDDGSGSPPRANGATSPSSSSDDDSDSDAGSDSDASDSDSDAGAGTNNANLGWLAGHSPSPMSLGLSLEQGCLADDWNPVQYTTAPRTVNPQVDDRVVEDCTPKDEDGYDVPDEALRDAPPSVTDLNGIALRLCVQGFADAQRATEASLKKCKIVKIAAIGYKMFDAGLTLQSTLKGVEGAPDTEHMFVPKYMSIAPNQARGKRDLSLLYQLIGRGFVDMKADELPADWKLDLLATQGTRNLCKLYGNTELLLSQVRGESLEGRKMTLGTVLRVIKSGGEQTYGEVARHALKGKERAKVAKNMFECLSIAEDLPGDDEHRQIDRPFCNVRECLNGKYAPKGEGQEGEDGDGDGAAGPASLASEEEFGFGGLVIVDMNRETRELSIKEVAPEDCSRFPSTAEELVWRDQSLGRS